MFLDFLGLGAFIRDKRLKIKNRNLARQRVLFLASLFFRRFLRNKWLFSHHVPLIHFLVPGNRGDHSLDYWTPVYPLHELMVLVVLFEQWLAQVLCVP
jgi:hypothetical protein